MKQYDLICIGCGPAGEKAATQAAYFGKRVAIIERDARPGGAMVNTGTIPSKALRETALLCSGFRRRPIPGLNLTFADDMTVPQFMAQRQLIQQEEHDRIESSLDRHQIDVVPGNARILDPHTVAIRTACGTEQTLTSEFILIATGSRPARPDHVPFDHPSIVDADGILDIETMPRNMLIVGGGVIGCEYASIFAEIDVQVTLMEPRSCLLPFVDPECREILERALRDVDVDVRCDSAIEAFVPHDGERLMTVRTADGSEMTFDTVLWAAGRQGNAEGLGLEELGIEANKRGSITVDDRYCTAVPSIYAAGDIIGFPMLTSTSMEQGRIAVCHMFDIPFKRNLASSFPIGLYTIPPIAAVGISEHDAHQQGRRIVVGRAPYRLNARGRMYRDDAGLFKVVFDRDSGALLGATIVGEQATELIHTACAVMAANQGIDYFINACFNYPSISDLYKYAAYNALQQMHTPQVRSDHHGERACVA